ncbi:lactase/phlorizin hydrolase-like [Gastrophryne carolinensis]
MVTLYHWDLPQALEETGGWQNDSIIDTFAEYADFCFSSFGDRVKHWITFHEPWVVSYAGYGTGEHAPGISEPGKASFKVTHNIVKAHAKAWHVYNDIYRSNQQGKVGISLNSDWAEPETPNDPESVSATERYLQFMLGWFAHPILINGDYPDILKTQVHQKNTQCSSIVDPLPIFSETEKTYIQGTADFLGISHYTSRLINASRSATCMADYENIGGFTSRVDPSWPSTASPWISVVPWGLRRLLNFVNEEYGKGGLPIYITGNGMPTSSMDDVFNDTARVEYLTAYINEALKAVRSDGVSVSAYVVRSLLDGFEGPEGYSQRFGLHYVDFENSNRQRTPKESAYLLSTIAENNGFPSSKSTRTITSSRWPHAKKLPLQSPSDVPSKAKVVWEKFSGQTAFERDMYYYLSAPKGFMWGASTSAYQVEGAWNEDGKGPSIWDTFTHIPGNIFANHNGDIASDSYHQLDADLYMLRGLGVNSYRFSISWSRIFPTGQSTLNSKGVDYYNRLLDGLVANNIAPMVTLYHFDLPQALQDLGGWESDIVVTAFENYADFCFKTFGDRVKFWMTFHQPQTIASFAYGIGIFPPGVKDDPGFAPYRVARNLLMAHARVYHTYNDKYRGSQGGVISISLNTNWAEPKDHTNLRDIEAADRYLQFTLGWFAHPIFKNGDYPEAMKWQVANKSELQGLSSSRLPIFTEEEKAYIQGTADVFSINIYTTKLIQNKPATLKPPSYNSDTDIVEEFDDSWHHTAHPDVLRAVAWGMRRLLNWIKEEYGDIPIYVTESGLSTDSNPDYDDTERIFYYKTYIEEALKAYSLDGVNLRGYCAWSLMDTFEWDQGYRLRYGLHHVDFNNPNRPRTAKRTAMYYADVIRNNGIQDLREEFFLYDEFRPDFAWGVASSAFQIEGGWRSDGKGISIWDQFTHTPSKIVDSSNGDVACDSYHHLDEDVDMLKNLKVTHYRFSISWPRVLPDGTLNFVNEPGLDYYNRLINALLAAGITPQVTIYHWDLPQALENEGGWQNDTIVQRFKDYAELLFQRLGDRVKFWITLNEPYIVANLGYGEGSFAPGIESRGVGVYVAGHNLIKAHAEAWHLYNDKYRATQGGLISITLNSDWAEPINEYRQEDIDAARRYLLFFSGWFGYPIFKTGDYPEIMKTRVRERSLAVGLPKSRLPEFTESEKQRIKGTYDFFGLNHYTSVLAGQAIYDLNYQAYEGDRGVYLLSDRTWLGSGSIWLRVAPFGLRRLLNWIKEEFNNPPIYITENGISERGTNLQDVWREHYYRYYINEALKAVKLDGVDLRGYSAWSLMDNFEWAMGYTERFGLYYTNFTDPSLPRIPKDSAKFYKSIVRCNGFPNPRNITHPCFQPEQEPDVSTTTTRTTTRTTQTHPTTRPTTGPPEDPESNSVSFLGLDISTEDAMVALYVEFGLLLTSVLAVILFIVLYIKLRKKLKKTHTRIKITKKNTYTEQAASAKMDHAQVGSWDKNAGCASSWVADKGLFAVAGPLQNGERLDSQIGFKCVDEDIQEINQHVPVLQKYGVTHYKIYLDQNSLLNDNRQVQCYQSLFQILANAGIRPAVVLQKGGVLTSDNPNELYVNYADFAFHAFRGLVNTWITFDIPKDEAVVSVQGLLEAHVKVSTLFHSKYSTTGGQLSIAAEPSLLDVFFTLQGHFLESLDFLALNLEYDCQNSNQLQSWSSHQSFKKHLKMLVFDLTLVKCDQNLQDDHLLPYKIYTAVTGTGASFLGFDVKHFLPASLEKGRLEKQWERLLPTRSAFTTVWERFANQTPAERDAFLPGTFPNGFLWGSSSAAFKVEGGWAEGGRGESIWDVFGHHGHTIDNATADVACDSYNKIAYDVYLLKGLQVKVYHFSISWSRVFPTGQKSSVSSIGVKYYNKLIDRLLEENITPMVTLYHWDLPQALQETGGWQNDSIIDNFAEYADFCFSSFGDRVKHWITFHEPWVVSYAGYGTGEHAPGISEPGKASFKVTHNIVKAHAKAWHVYNDIYRSNQQGKVGISLNSDWAEPETPNDPESVSATERYLQFMLGWFAHPILINGDYPDILKTQVHQKNTQCSSIVDPLPIFSETEKTYIQGTADFLGISHYTSRLINASSSATCMADYENIGGFTSRVDPSWPSTASPWISVVPWGLRRLLNFVNEEYGKGGLPIYITGNGMPTSSMDDVFNDTARVEYLTAYINEALKAVRSDGVSVSAYVVRSLLDGFEGPEGYSERFGLHYVDFKNSNRQRTPKESAYLLSTIAENNGFPSSKCTREISSSRWPHAKKLPLQSPSDVPSMAKVVWEKFSGQTAFERDMYYYLSAPKGFMWGASTSAYQVEGAWNEDGKGPSIWDTFTHIPGNIFANHNGDIASDSYHQLDADLYMLRGLGVNSYRFSISWSRIFPTGQGTLNNKGVDYYNRLIDGLVANNIAPMVTLYHFDLPQALQDLGGWESDVVVTAFENYADFCFKTFGDRVKFWMTFHQPQTIASFAYGIGIFPPGVKDDPGFAPYRVARNLLMAHARVYHTYDDKYRGSQGGVISISLNTNWAEPKDPTNLRDIEAADRYLQFTLGWFAHPIFKNGDYPEAMKWQVANKSELQGLSSSRLPIFTEEEKAYIQGTADVFSINIYTTKLIHHKPATLKPPSYNSDTDIVEEFDDSWHHTAHPDVLRAVAWGMRRLLNWIKEEYGDIPIYVTESGLSTDSNPDYDDTERIFYYKTYIEEALKAYSLDGVNLRGYCAWSLMDAFEWEQGYRLRYGLHHVDFNNPNRPRTAKRTAMYYADVIRNNGIQDLREEFFLYDEFRPDFAWGVASSAFQIEGGWRADGKGISIWDQFTHTPSNIEDGSNGDVACDSYHHLDEDVDMLKNLKVTHYRFSISWPRVLPDGTLNFVNEPGLDYYNRLINALLAAGITPQVTIYHWDLPQALENEGGWLNETIVERFKDYAELLFQRLGDRVKFWITLNEPYIIAHLGYGEGVFAPGIVSRGVGVYVAGHNLIKAHAEVWHLYNDKYRATQGGLISITLNIDWAEPINEYRQEDIDAARRYLLFFGGWFGYPIFKTGDYPEVMKTSVRERSLAFGLPKSRLPEFTESEKQRIKGTYDFLGLNHYTTVLAGQAIFELHYQAYEGDRGVYLLSDRTWLGSGSLWLKVTPFGLRRVLNWIKEELNNPPIYITENGISERGTNLKDVWREHYYRYYINEALKAVKLDGVDLRGYSAWSLMDNFEWAMGYTERFGLYYTNFSDPSLPRIPKDSAKLYKSIVRCNGFPNPRNITHPCFQPEQEPEGETTTRTSTRTTQTHPTTRPTTGPPEDPESNSVSFLGLDISTEDAMVALYVEFALLLTSILAVILFIVLYIKLRSTLKKSTLS